LIPGSATLADISSADWSLMLDSTAAADGLASGIGNVVQGVDDVDQCIAIILTTPLVSDVLRPTFGADLWQYIDQPINRAIPAIVQEVTAAITKWEPRVQLISVVATPVIDATAQSGAHFNVAITWRLNLGGTPSPSQTTTVSIAGAFG
jgi:phage baseplate assembly protein W